MSIIQAIQKPPFRPILLDKKTLLPVPILRIPARYRCLNNGSDWEDSCIAWRIPVRDRWLVNCSGWKESCFALVI
jgi:hypothetical protein